MSDHIATVLDQWRQRRPDLDLDGMAVCGRIERVARIVHLRQVDVHHRYDLDAGDVDLLAALWRHEDGLRPKELRRSMMVGSGTLTGRLDRLEAAGLLERRPDPEDRRGRILHLTTKGRRLVPQVVEELLAVENDLLSSLSPAARKRLAKDLARVLSEAEPDAP